MEIKFNFNINKEMNEKAKLLIKIPKLTGIIKRREKRQVNKSDRLRERKSF